MSAANPVRLQTQSTWMVVQAAERPTFVYRPGEWLGRKLCAIPRALWSGVVLTVAHLAQGLFRGVTLNGKGSVISVKKVGWDLAAALGHVLTLFNDYRGAIMAERARQKKVALENPVKLENAGDKWISAMEDIRQILLGNIDEIRKNHQQLPGDYNYYTISIILEKNDLQKEVFSQKNNLYEISQGYTSDIFEPIVKWNDILKNLQDTTENLNPNQFKDGKIYKIRFVIEFSDPDKPKLMHPRVPLRIDLEVMKRKGEFQILNRIS